MLHNPPKNTGACRVCFKLVLLRYGDYILVSSLQAIHNNIYKDMLLGLPRYEGYEEIYCRCNEADRVGERR